MQLLKQLAFFASFLFLFQQVTAQQDPTKRVILVGIGGISAEAFQYANTPSINTLISKGAISLKTRGVMPTLSAPNWASVLSGAGPEQHGVTSNNWSLSNPGFEPTGKDADGYFPSIFTLIRKQKRGAASAMFYDWDWLGTYVNKKLLSKEQYIQGQVMITSVALNYIRNDKPLFTFLYYGLADKTGQSKGFTSKEYYQAISEIDTEIGKLVAGLQEMKMSQNTTLIITSDCGGSGYSHGGESTTELEVPWIISGQGVKQNVLLDAPNDNINTSPTIARILGLKTPEEWIGKPVYEAFISKSSSPKPGRYVPKPWCTLAEGSFSGPQQIELSTNGQGAKIYYTLDGSTPGVSSKKYTSPFTISKNCALNAVAISGGYSSQTLSRIYTFVRGLKKATLTSQPNPKYPGTGISGLFDGLIGSSNPGNNQWMGFQGNDFEVTIDLGEVKQVKTLALDVLQLHSACISLPQSIEFYSSNDSINYKLLTIYYPAETEIALPDGAVMLSRDFDNLRTQFIRIKVTNTRTCSQALPGEAKKTWFLLSEVEID